MHLYPISSGSQVPPSPPLARNQAFKVSLPTPGGNSSPQSSSSPSLEIFKPQQDPENPDISLGLVLLRGGSNIDLPVIVISTSVLPATYTSWTRGWTLAFLLKTPVILGYKTRGWMGLCLLSTLIFLQAKEFWTNHQNSNNPLLIDVLRALFLFLKWPLITHLFMVWRGEKMN